MSPRTLVALALVAGCLPGNYDTTDTTSGSSSDGSGGEPTSGGSGAGLFACDAPPCTLVIVSQTLDDRIDVHEVTGETSRLRGRIGLDLKPDPSDDQIMGNLLDEPYGLVLTPSDLLVAVGHYPDTDRGSLLRFPRSTFAELEPGATFGVDQYFSGGTFSAGVEALLHEREEDFLASKFTALFDIGMSDLRLSKDLEDIVFCFFYCVDIALEIESSDAKLPHFLKESITKLLQNPNIREAIYCTLAGGEVNEENMELIIVRLNRMRG